MNSYLHSKFRVISIICTILVVFVHSHNLLLLMSESEIIVRGGLTGFIENFISQGLTRVASPMFFMISGYLFFLNMKESRGWFLAKLKKRARSLLTPYLLWSLWGILFFFFLQTFPFTRYFFTGVRITDYSITDLLHTLFIQPIPYQLWFLRDLMMLVLISPVLYFLVKNFRLYPLIIFMVVWFFEIDFQVFDSRSLLFFSIGLYFALNSYLISERKYPRYALEFFACWVILSLVKSIMVFKGIDFIYWAIVQKFSVLSGLLALWCLYDRYFSNTDMTKLKVFPLFSFSLFIYTSHEPILTIVKKGMLASLGKYDGGVLISYFAAPNITITLCVLVGFILKKHLQKFYNIISGGR